MKRNMVKRMVSVMIAAALTFSLFACSEEPDEVKKVSEGADVTAEAESEDMESTSPDMTEIAEETEPESESESEKETKKSVAKTKTADSSKKTNKSATKAEDETEEETTVAEGEAADDGLAKENAAITKNDSSTEYHGIGEEEYITPTSTPTYAETTAAVNAIQETTAVAATTAAEEALDPMFDFNVTLPYSERIPLFDAAAASCEFMRLWNERRASLGLQPIATVYDTTNYDAIDSRIYKSCAAEIVQDIQESAKIRAEEIDVYYSHQRPNGLTWADFENQGLEVAQFNCECILASGGVWYQTNDAAWVAQHAFKAFMESDAHRNLMDNPEMSIGACWFYAHYTYTDVNDPKIDDAMREARTGTGGLCDANGNIIEPQTLLSWNDFNFYIAVEFQPL